jgi:hypothetical protein
MPMTPVTMKPTKPLNSSILTALAASGPGTPIPKTRANCGAEGYSVSLEQGFSLAREIAQILRESAAMAATATRAQADRLAGRCSTCVAPVRWPRAAHHRARPATSHGPSCPTPQAPGWPECSATCTWEPHCNQTSPPSCGNTAGLACSCACDQERNRKSSPHQCISA